MIPPTSWAGGAGREERRQRGDVGPEGPALPPQGSSQSWSPPWAFLTVRGGVMWAGVGSGCLGDGMRPWPRLGHRSPTPLPDFSSTRIEAPQNCGNRPASRKWFLGDFISKAVRGPAKGQAILFSSLKQLSESNEHTGPLFKHLGGFQDGVRSADGGDAALAWWRLSPMPRTRCRGSCACSGARGLCARC